MESWRIPRAWMLATIALEMIAIIIIHLRWTNSPSWIVLVVFFSGLIAARIVYICKQKLQKGDGDEPRLSGRKRGGSG